MFTGIITDIGTVKAINNDGGDWRIGIETNLDLSKTDIGASIACAGCCLTVVEKKDNVFYVDVSAETLSKTNIGNWQEGAKINLEPSLKVGDELGGHIVSGHVDGLAKLRMKKAEGDSHRLYFMVPPELNTMVAVKGSVALDGVSLTVNEVECQHFEVNIIPHTWDHTTLGSLKDGDTVHIEVDVLARYVARALSFRDA
jgi:riboflavin synthase